MSTSTTYKLRGRPARLLALVIGVLLVIAGGITITEPADTPPPPARETASTTATGTTIPGVARSADVRSLTKASGCPRPNVPPKDPKALRDVAEPLRSYMHTAIIDARAGGLALYLVSGGRSDSQQWDLRHGRVPAGQECNPAYKGNPRTAIPGRSRHRNTGAYENGKLVAAADMGGALAWLHAHQACYGISFPVPGENWHVEVTGRAPTCTIIPFNAPVARWIPFGAGESDLSIANRGGFATEVTEVQLILTRLGYRPGGVDGRYGPASQAALGRFKADVIKLQRATGQPRWPDTGPYVGPRTVDMLRFFNRAASTRHALAA